MNPQRQVLKSRWGLDPVVVSEMRREVGDDKRWMRRQANSSTEGGDLDSGDDQDEETEETGVTLWDCAQVLWDLLSNPRSSLSVQGKVIGESGERGCSVVRGSSTVQTVQHPRSTSDYPYNAEGTDGNLSVRYAASISQAQMFVPAR